KAQRVQGNPPTPSQWIFLTPRSFRVSFSLQHRITFNTRHAGRINRIHVTRLILENPSGASTNVEGDRMYNTKLIEREMRHVGLIVKIHDHHTSIHSNHPKYVIQS